MFVAALALVAVLLVDVLVVLVLPPPLRLLLPLLPLPPAPYHAIFYLQVMLRWLGSDYVAVVDADRVLLPT
jgi:hypothetical protein